NRFSERCDTMASPPGARAPPEPTDPPGLAQVAPRCDLFRRARRKKADAPARDCDHRSPCQTGSPARKSAQGSEWQGEMATTEKALRAAIVATAGRIAE